jgi:hypothetical protein
MPDAPDIPCDSNLGKFDPEDARRLMSLLEAAGIPFALEIEARPKWGNAHAGSWIVIFVPEDSFQAGNDLARALFPPESAPPG